MWTMWTEKETSREKGGVRSGIRANKKKGSTGRVHMGSFALKEGEEALERKEKRESLDDLSAVARDIPPYYSGNPSGESRWGTSTFPSMRKGRGRFSQ